MVSRNRAQGAFIRSRLKWLEEDKSNSSYFFQLEKHRAKSNTFQQLNINGQIISDPTCIAKHVSSFYSKLYDLSESDENIEQLLNNIDIQQIQPSKHDKCDSPLSTSDILICTKQLKNNKSPGPDGLTVEFFKLFSDHIAPFLTCVYLEYRKRNSSSNSKPRSNHSNSKTQKRYTLS